MSIAALLAKLKMEWYIHQQQVKVSKAGCNTYKILFSPKERWQLALEKVCLPLGHELRFEIFNQENIGWADIVVPFGAEDLRFLEQHRGSFSEEIIPIPSKAAFELCEDKALLNQQLSSDYPDLIPPEPTVDQYPFILKKRQDQWARNTFLVRNQEEADRYRDEIDSADYFIQSFVPGRKEYACHLLMIDGQLKSAVEIEYVFGTKYPIKGKQQHSYIALADNRFGELWQEILRKIGFEGICCINYKVEDGQPKLLEINPRFGGSLCRFFPSFLLALHEDQ